MARTFKNPNPLRIKLIEDLKNFNADKDYGIWNAVIRELSKSKRNARTVNLWKINKYTNEGDVIVVPGKVLGQGDIDHKVTIAAFEFSEGIKQKATNNNVRLMSIYELFNENPKGTNVKIIG
ncbi:MAG: 50S ribosomal protein L18e [Candidatus Altiarchaeum hamiconexum]|uniref:Large ribosomal subunit protein eL18 n=1 Tax=Candidatus Altarchaeum hamiconexum TaxID=1803513 RepID=A0A8J8CFH4_9ARCH|nr:50S ribosomal protein L18e [Candidatus Altarchaeum hamiconexum]OIQ06197.1 MAG: 50S ribosomal protein L18e [Candidatus Altarchaeum sp. CG2_30_32_3053]PIN67483.1 MAG: 50S ribosomal protein L18e [Candidatus Altarchaeum sp. CG12_big_fil_rev_8_21_14_0_65_33_22]PIV27042.1 MAG: 50S ribosomal protein L18e [Candidatus Altarchaeum sp. CG03_land_8_20_14_0_80_32_618]PIX49092.1 MAG: 50S ribosomal protein L18e [Candidatus Altarchaeum sp. CG_4_8_14_3_um_filter_33_2054]PIZ32414.1 MAG: 50S ribosomal protein